LRTGRLLPLQTIIPGVGGSRGLTQQAYNRDTIINLELYSLVGCPFCLEAYEAGPLELMNLNPPQPEDPCFWSRYRTAKLLAKFNEPKFSWRALSDRRVLKTRIAALLFDRRGDKSGSVGTSARISPRASQLFGQGSSTGKAGSAPAGPVSRSFLDGAMRILIAL
jgi:hypothetical protein